MVDLHPSAVGEGRRIGPRVQLDADCPRKRLRDHRVRRAGIDEHPHRDGLVAGERDGLMKLSHRSTVEGVHAYVNVQQLIQTLLFVAEVKGRRRALTIAEAADRIAKVLGVTAAQ